jgi:hypothetical protein
MAKFLLLSKVLAAVITPVLVQGIKIAFVGDTGMEGTSTGTNFVFTKSNCHDSHDRCSLYCVPPA